MNIGNIELLNIDCMKYMWQVPNNYFDLAIVDPPYGIDIEQRVFKDGKIWDKEIPPKEYFQQLFRISKNQIIWGGNYFIDHLYPTKCFLIWDKKITDSHTFSMCEFAWTSFDTNAKVFYQPPAGHRGFYKIDGDRIHPTQKSVDLYKWILANYAKEGYKIFDSHGGSMSSAIACNDYGFELTLCEVDEDYYTQGVQRFKNHIAQLTLSL